MKFSVLIANYNNSELLEIAIKSVLQQTYKNFEIIIVDDCSTDNSKLTYEKYKNDSRVKIFFNEQNNGCGYTKRKCVEFATGEICGFLDPDDAITQNALEDMVQAHLENPNASLVSSCYYKCDENLKIMYLRKLKPKCKDYLYANDTDLHFASFKRELYLKTSGIDAKFKRAVDQDLYLKLSEVGNFAYIPKYHYYYRTHKNGISTILNDNSNKAFQWFVLAKYDACRRRNLDFDNINLPHPELNISSIRRVLKIRSFFRKLYIYLLKFLGFHKKLNLAFLK